MHDRIFILLLLNCAGNPGEQMHLSEILKSRVELYYEVISLLHLNSGISLGNIAIEGDSDVTTQAGDTGNVVALSLPE